MKHSKIAIIGAGLVGSTTAYALLLQNITAEIVLVDIDKTRCKGEVFDLMDALAFDGTSQIKSGTLQDAAQADIIIIAAGKPQNIGEPRTALLATNKTVISSIFNEIKPINPQAIIVVVTNPVDLITYHTQSISGLPRNQVFGSGTFLDTQRLRNTVARAYNINQESVDVYVFGEHGDSQYAAWSSATIGGTPLLQLPHITQTNLDSMETEVKEKAYEIIACKGSTYYGIAACIARICKAIIFNQQLVLPLSIYLSEYDVCLSVPVVLGEKGIEKILPLSLSNDEQKQFINSVTQLKKELL